MAFFPYRTREGDLPLKLLKNPKKGLEFLFECHDIIAEQQSKERWSKTLIQNIFEHFCYEMKAAPI